MNGYLALSYGDRTCEIQKVRFLGNEWEGPWFLYALGSSGIMRTGLLCKKICLPMYSILLMVLRGVGGFGVTEQ